MTGKSLATHAIIATLCLTLAACAAVPFSTLWKLRNLTPQTFVELVPEGILMRLETSRDYTVDTTLSTLTVTLGEEEQAYSEDLTMRLLTGGEVTALTRAAEWADDGNEYIFALDEPGLAAFKRLQKVVQRDTYDVVKIDVGFEPLGWPEESDYMPLSVDLRLKREDGFFRLFDQVQLPISDAALERAAAAGKVETR